MAIAFPDPQPVDHLTAVAKAGKSHGKLWNPRGVAINPATNHIYVAEGGYSFERVSIFSESGEYLNSYFHLEMRSLWGIAIHGNNVYITDLAHLRLVARQGSRGSGLGQFDEPRQLSISTIGDVYIADTDNNRIQILDCSLQPKGEVTHQSMHRPYDVKYTPEEIYALSSDDSPCVHVFNHTGHKIRSLITRGGGMHATRPYFFCLDNRKNLLSAMPVLTRSKYFQMKELSSTR